MSQIARTAALTPTATPYANRLSAAARVASTQSSPAGVEELSTRVGVSYDDSMFSYQDEGSGGLPRRQHAPIRGVELFSTPSSAFAAAFEAQEYGQSENAAGGGGPEGGSLTQRLAKAISTYETNTRVISGTDNMRGTNLRLTL